MAGRARRSAATASATTDSTTVSITVAITISLGAFTAACTSAPEPEPTVADYRRALTAVCTETSAARELLVEPTATDEVVAFARSVGMLLDDEAARIRALRVPSELADDHRALAQNTADQADVWLELAATSPTDTAAFGNRTDQIAALSFGRDDLADAMEVPACRRGQ